MLSEENLIEGWRLLTITFDLANSVELLVSDTRERLSYELAGDATSADLFTTLTARSLGR